MMHTSETLTRGADGTPPSGPPRPAGPTARPAPRCRPVPRNVVPGTEAGA